MAIVYSRKYEGGVSEVWQVAETHIYRHRGRLVSGADIASHSKEEKKMADHRKDITMVPGDYCRQHSG
jgi:hypothetical protein